MIGRILVSLLSLAVCSLASAAERRFEPVVSDGQQIEFSNGEATVFAHTARAIVLVSYLPGDKKTGFLKIGVQNLSDSAFNISEESVTAESGGTALPVLTYADRVKGQKRSQMWASIGAGLAAASNNMAASNAGYSNTYGTYSGRTTAQAYGSGGYANASANTYGSYSGTTYNAGAAFAAQQAANARNQAIFSQQKLNAESAKLDLESRALRANTLSPQEVVFGDIQMNLPKAKRGAAVEFSVSIDIAGEVVVLRFREKG